MGLWRMGTRPMAPAVERAGFAIGSYLRDGMNTHAYLRGHLVDGSDPEGLFFGLAFQMATTAVDAVGTVTGTMEEVYSGMLTISTLEQFTEEYALNQLIDGDWAGDWSQGDNWYSQSGISDAAMWGSSAAQGGSSSSGMEMAGAFDGQTPTMALGDRRHGGERHNRVLRSLAELWIAKAGPQNVRFNQSIKLADGSSIRPDLVVYDKGKYHVFEVQNTNVLTDLQHSDRHASIAKSLGVNQTDVEYMVTNVSDGSSASAKTKPPRLRSGSGLPGRRRR